MNYEVTEVCPHCEREITLNWNVETDGYQIFCPECGKAVMLCSMCDRSPCDWSETGCKHSKDNYEAVNSDGWIPVEERLPEDGWEVLCCDDKAVYLVEYQADWDAPFGDMDGIIAWRPLPEPYRPEVSHD